MRVLVIGSAVIDLFLDIEKSHAVISDSTVQLKLGDKIPSEIKSLAVGGNAANVAVGLKRFGIDAALYTYLGNEILSQEIETRLTQEKITLHVDRHEGTAPLHIILDFDTDRIIFSHYQKHEHEFTLSNHQQYDYIYLTSLADEWKHTYSQILNFAKQKSIPIAFSPGSRQLAAVGEVFKNTLQQTSILFSNKEEAQCMLGTQNDDIHFLLAGLTQHGPQIVSITDGARGAYVIDSQKNMYKIDSIQEKFTDKTGAGDAYASGFFAAYILHYDIIDCMKWGILNAAAKMKQIGSMAGLLTLDGMKSAHNNNMFLVAQKL